MHTTNRRINTIKTLIAGSSVSSHSRYNIVLGEFNEVRRCAKVSKKNRKFLLQILHSTRALDSTLSAIIQQKRLNPQQKSLGAYLHCFTHHNDPSINRLNEGERRTFQTNIVDKRNKYMHEAGAYPNQGHEILTLLAEMHTCIARIVSL